MRAPSSSSSSWFPTRGCCELLPLRFLDRGPGAQEPVDCPSLIRHLDVRLLLLRADRQHYLPSDWIARVLPEGADARVCMRICSRLRAWCRTSGGLSICVLPCNARRRAALRVRQRASHGQLLAEEEGGAGSITGSYPWTRDDTQEDRMDGSPAGPSSSSTYMHSSSNGVDASSSSSSLQHQGRAAPPALSNLERAMVLTSPVVELSNPLLGMRVHARSSSSSSSSSPSQSSKGKGRHGAPLGSVDEGQEQDQDGRRGSMGVDDNDDPGAGAEMEPREAIRQQFHVSFAGTPIDGQRAEDRLMNNML